VGETVGPGVSVTGIADDSGAGPVRTAVGDATASRSGTEAQAVATAATISPIAASPKKRTLPDCVRPPRPSSLSASAAPFVGAARKARSDRLDVDDAGTPEVGAEFARYWRETPKLVVSRGHPELGPNATKLEGNVVEAVRGLKSSDGPPIAVGAGADLFATLAEAGLIDRYRWLVIPKAIGQGKSLFSSLTRPLDLRLVGTRTFDSGAVLLDYEPAG
jgi:RibD C-terminal domain